MAGLLLATLVTALVWPACLAYCPPGCHCNHTRLAVTCTNSSLGPGHQHQ